MTVTQSDRIATLRRKQLNSYERELLDNIEEFGFQVTSVVPEDGPAWSYTIGLHDQLSKPEFVITGMPSKLAHSVLRDIVDRLREGESFDDGCRKSHVLQKVECEFRLVEPRWIERLLLSAVWFNGNTEFQVLQCVYPDFENRFPWEAGFDSNWRARQPLLFPTPVLNEIESNFWRSQDDD